MTDRIEQAQQITAEQLKTGGFVFQLPDNATDDDRKGFSQMLQEARDKNLNVVINHNVKIIDLKSVQTPSANVPQTAPETPVAQEAPKQETPATPETPKTTETKTEPEKPKEEAKPVNPYGYGYSGQPVIQIIVPPTPNINPSATVDYKQQ